MLIDDDVDQLGLMKRRQERGSALSLARWLSQHPGMRIGGWGSWSGYVVDEYAAKFMRVGSDPAQQRGGQRYDYWNGQRMRCNPGNSERVLCDFHVPPLRSSWHRYGRYPHRRAPTTAPSPSVAAAVAQSRPPLRHDYLDEKGNHYPRKQAASSSENSDEVAAAVAVTATAAPCVLASARYLGQYGRCFGAAAAAAGGAAAVGRGACGP